MMKSSQGSKLANVEDEEGEAKEVWEESEEQVH